MKRTAHENRYQFIYDLLDKFEQQASHSVLNSALHRHSSAVDVFALFALTSSALTPVCLDKHPIGLSNRQRFSSNHSMSYLQTCLHSVTASLPSGSDLTCGPLPDTSRDSSIRARKPRGQIFRNTSCPTVLGAPRKAENLLVAFVGGRRSQSSHPNLMPDHQWPNIALGFQHIAHSRIDL